MKNFLIKLALFVFIVFSGLNSADATKIIEICEDESYEYVDEAYELRGQAKRELGDLKGACEDWKKAAELGREDAVKLLEENCS